MTDRRRQAAVHRAVVLRTERLTPHMIRVVVGGDGLAGFAAGQYTDHYIKILFPQAGVDYPEPLDMEAVRRDMPRESWPRVRTYTVRAWDQANLELTIDFVHHGDEGLAGPWAAQAQPGDPVLFLGPGGAYAPDPTADWHLLIGDESALPAIGAALERLPADAKARVLVEVSGPEEEQKFAATDELRVTWVHRGDRPIGDALVAAVRELDFPTGTVHAFVHGEANFVRDLRRFLRIERNVPRESLSISGYWRRGADEEGWQSTKAEFNRDVTDEVASVSA
jgi:NADPH-dependent ferric siderophore reductase